MRQTQFFSLKGGEDLVSPIYDMKAGMLQSSRNYEVCVNGGYRRVDGYERYDGHLSPSSILRGDYSSDEEWIAAMEAARSNISAVPGDGPIRGIWIYGGDTYAFRNNGAVCYMHKATPSGWTLVPMNYEIPFSAGTSVIAAGDTITGNTSSATGTVSHIVVTSGDWSTSDAAGYIALEPSHTGTFGSETISVSGTSSATITGQTQISFPKDGSYEFINHNFYGSSDREEMYGVNKVGYAFGFNGTSVWFIRTGMPDDRPAHIIAHKRHLFLSFAGGSVQHSSIGEPSVFNAVTGAAEIAIGQECVGFSTVPGEALAIFGRNKIDILYGSSSSDWQLSNYSSDAGAVEGSIQSINIPYFLDDRGVKKLSTSMNYGDFEMSTISQKIQPVLDELRGKLSCSLRVRNKNQYRLFFTDGTIICLTIDDGKIIGITRFNYGHTDTADNFYSKPMVRAISVEDTDGSELLLAGDDDGFVYHLDKGPSFDGEKVRAWVFPIFNHFGSPEKIKRFMKATLEIDASERFTLSFIPEFSFGDEFYPQAAEQLFSVTAGSGIWDESKWDEFSWDSNSLSFAYAYMVGIGKNFRLAMYSECQYEAPHTLQGLIIHFSRKGYVK